MERTRNEYRTWEPGRLAFNPMVGEGVDVDPERARVVAPMTVDIVDLAILEAIVASDLHGDE